ncbi:A-kinase anchoring protein 7 [Sceloporus undulatus]|uniref:A-kinase anchoring protein 7 n=1 Tax=Sceloporus undulatus TaxID=8520 RepID=UPI001C4C20EC|nr:A-kinase anchoring protein 7 [Sceloporus undulatus]
MYLFLLDSAIGAFLKSKGSIEELLQGKPLDLSFQGIDHFRNQVGFVKLTENESTATLLKIAESVKNIFLDKGICIEDERAFKPHLTFMKLSKSPELRKQGVKKIDPSLFENFKNHYFGDESMIRLDLCSMFKKKQSNGYYHCESSITIALRKTTWASGKEKQPLHVEHSIHPCVTHNHDLQIVAPGEKRGAEPDDAELLSLSKRLVENAVLKAVQQYLEETQNKNRQIDCGTAVKNEEPALGNNIENENDNSK